MGARIFIQILFSKDPLTENPQALTKFFLLCIGFPRKNKLLFVKHFLDDYKHKIIEILYTRSGQYCLCEGPHLKKL